MLGCPDDHAALAGSPAAAALPANRGVMLVVERNKDNTLHFFDTQKYRHYTFAHENLDGYGDMATFNAEMYYQPSRRLFLATLTHYLGPNIFALEISPIDKAPPEMLAQMFGIVKKALRWPADLRYHPTSNALEMDSRLPAGVPIVTTEELYADATYQGLNLGRTIGRVHLTTLAELPAEYVSRLDLVVIDSVPNDISAVAGLVTGEFQTPLSHVNLLSQNRGTPNMALKGALDEPAFKTNDGKWVELVVAADGFQVTPSTKEAADAFWASRRPDHDQAPDLDLSQTALVDIEQTDASWVARIGGKAANFGEMTRIVPAIPLPDAFAIPCSAYVSFMEHHGLDARVQTMLDDPKFMSDGLWRKEQLEALRETIRGTAVDADLLAAVQAKIDTDYGTTIPIRLRSSSNVEDLEGFNGAGIYDSYSYKPGDPTKTLEQALTHVWSSLWNLSAFEEREWARIDHSKCAMGVLVHPSFPDNLEAANGVAITANPFDPQQSAYFVNAQAGATSVANPVPGVTADSFLYYKPPAGGGEMSYLSYSSLNRGKPVLSFEEIVELVGYLRGIHEHFQKLYGAAEPFGMDVEFKLTLPSRDISIKQARSYPF
jgi:hypothetical protein